MNSADWERNDIDVPLEVIESTYREFTGPVIEYIRRLHTAHARDIVSVYIPEYVVDHWWENLLHNQSSLRLKVGLLFVPGVMVTSVPCQLRASGSADESRALTRA